MARIPVRSGREEEAEGRAVARLAGDFDPAAVGFDGFLDDGEAEAGALRFGGQKRLEQFRPLLGGHPGPGILESQNDEG